MQYKPETNNEARLRDARASEEIARIQHQGQLAQGRTAKNEDTRSKTAGGKSARLGAPFPFFVFVAFFAV